MKHRYLLQAFMFNKYVPHISGQGMQWVVLCRYHSVLCLLNHIITWWRRQMETFSALMALCAENSLVTGEFSSERPVRQTFSCFLWSRLIKQCKQSRRRWFQTPSRSLWCHGNETPWSYSKEDLTRNARDNDDVDNNMFVCKSTAHGNHL